MVKIEDLKIGQAVSYKQNGRYGSFEAIVTGIGLKRVGIKILSWNGAKIKTPEGLPRYSEVYRNVSPKSLWIRSESHE